MKQHIARKQLKELNEEKYKELINILEGNNLASYCSLEMGDKYLTQEINIGVMVEIIGYNNCLTLEQENIIPNDPDYGLKWVVRIFHNIDCPIKEYEAEELCDALWEAVKEVL